MAVYHERNRLYSRSQCRTLLPGALKPRKTETVNRLPNLHSRLIGGALSAAMLPAVGALTAGHSPTYTGPMCGRFTQKYTWEELHRLYRLTQPPRNIRPQYNIFPTDSIDVVIQGDSGLLAVPMRWQLIPPWWTKSLKELPATFNARAETVAKKAMFRDAFERTRCVIPASGYYEWETRPDGKQPYYITSTDGPVMTIAGLWSEWRDRVNDDARHLHDGH